MHIYVLCFSNIQVALQSTSECGRDCKRVWSPAADCEAALNSTKWIPNNEDAAGGVR